MERDVDNSKVKIKSQGNPFFYYPKKGEKIKRKAQLKKIEENKKYVLT